MTDYALGLDLGTSGLKGVLCDVGGAVAATASAPYDFESPRSGWAQIEPLRWEAAALRVVRELVPQVPDGRIVGLAIDGQMHGMVLVDGRGEAVYPAILWPDTRAVNELGAWADAPVSSLRAFANPLAAGMAGPMLAWLSRHEPRAFASGVVFLSPKDWLRSRLLPGSFVTDASDASATLLWDVEADGWNRSFAAAVGLAHLLPEVRPSAEIAGHLAAWIAQRWGLPAALPVAVGAADAAATLLGMDARPGVLSLILGSGAQALLVDVPPAASATPAFHTFRATDDGYYAMAASLNGGIALGRVRELLGLEWAELYESLRVPLQASDPVFLPYFAGERLPRAILPSQAGWQGIGLSTTREVLAAAAVEGMLFGVRSAIAALPENSGTVDLVGGGSRHPFVQQLVADVLGRPVARRSGQNATALGAAALAWTAAGASMGYRTSPATEASPRHDPATDLRFRRFSAATAALSAESS